MIYKQAKKEGLERLFKAGVPDVDVDTSILMEYVTGKKASEIFLIQTEEMPPEDEKRFFDLIAEREKRIPLQHITGSQEFMGLTFKVNEHTLVPRQDTEILVEDTIKRVNDGDRILDVCTGSGCILISVLRFKPLTTGMGVDISEEALKVAKENAESIDVKADFIQSDLFTNVEKKFDIIVSNPPYIPSRFIPELMPEVRDHDPMNALDGGEDGLTFYRLIAKEAPEYLFSHGRLSFEIGVGEREDVEQIMTENGFKDIEVIKDYSGNERVITGHL